MANGKAPPYGEVKRSPTATTTGGRAEHEAAQVGRLKSSVPVGYGAKVDTGAWTKAVPPNTGKKTC
jgi:hypothetical protein